MLYDRWMNYRRGPCRTNPWGIVTRERSVFEPLEPRYVLSAAITGPGLLTVEGTDGVDLISLRYRGPKVQVIHNGVVNRFLASGITRIEVYSRGGNDIVDLSGLAIPAYVLGGEGHDRIYGGSGNDTLTGASGRDTIWGGSGNDRITGGHHNDVLYGQDGSDVLYGSQGNDYIDGATGIDWLFGEDGDDSLIGGAHNDRIYGGNGKDRLLGQHGNDLLVGDSGNDWIWGGIGNDQISGSNGTDRLFGEDDDDSIFSRDNTPDYIDSGSGNDTLDSDLTEASITHTETINRPNVSTPPDPDPPPVPPPPSTPPTPPAPPPSTPVQTEHPVSISFSDEAYWDENFSTAVAEAKKLGATSLRIWLSLGDWNERPQAWDTITKRQLVNTWVPTPFEPRASIAGLAIKRAFELKREGFNLTVTVVHYAGQPPENAQQVQDLFNHLLNATETPTGTTRLKDVIDLWEIGNEVDASHGWKPSANNRTEGMKGYVDQLLIPAAETLKNAGETVISGSVRYSHNDLRVILEQLKTRGMLSYIDYAGFHAYGTYDPSAPDDFAKSSLPYYTQKAVEVARSYGKEMIATEWNVRGFSSDGSQNTQWASAINQVYRQYVAPNYKIAYYYALINNYSGRGGNPSARPAGALKHDYSQPISPTSSVDDLIAYYTSPLIPSEPFYSMIDEWK